MLSIEDIKDFCPVFMTPTHDGKLFQNYFISFLKLQSAFHKIGIPFEYYVIQGESLITRARNNSVATFLDNKKWTHLFWIDSDIGFTPEAVLRLLRSNYEVAAGVYPLKYEAWPENGLPTNMTMEEFLTFYSKYPVNTTVDSSNEVHIHITPDGFIEVNEAPTGFMVIKRNVFEKMMDAYPELQYIPDSIGFENKGLHYRFFDVMVHPETKRYYSEDYGFCYLWNKLGGKVYIDAKSNLSHQGLKLYNGSFEKSLYLNFQNAISTKPGAKVFIYGRKNLGDIQLQRVSEPPKT